MLLNLLLCAGNIHVSTTISVWVKNKSCQSDLRISEQTDIAAGTTTLKLGSDVVDLDSSDFRDVTSSGVEDDFNLMSSVGSSCLRRVIVYSWLPHCDLVMGFLRAPRSETSWRVDVSLATSVCSEKWKSGWQDLFLTHVYTNPDECEYYEWMSV